MYPFGCTNYPVTNMYEADLSYILNEVKELKNAAVNPGILAEKGSLITVGARNCNFKTINEAIEYARTFCTTTNRALILIMPGTYAEEITLMPNPGIDLFGLGMPVVQMASGYPNSPIYMTGTGSVYGIHFKAQGGNSYALHIEGQNVSNPDGEMIFTNCIFESNVNAAAGCGMKAGMTAYFNGCRFVSTARPAFYAHNYPATSIGYQVIRCNGCSFFGANQDVWLDDAVGCYGNGTDTSNLITSFANCSGSVNKVLFRKTLNDTYTYVPDGERVQIEQSSINTLPGVDHNNRTIYLNGYYSVGSNGAVGINCHYAERYDWAIGPNDCYAINNPTVALTASIAGVIADQVNVSISGGASKICQVFAVGHPK